MLRPHDKLKARHEATVSKGIVRGLTTHISLGSALLPNSLDGSIIRRLLAYQHYLGPKSSSPIATLWGYRCLEEDMAGMSRSLALEATRGREVWRLTGAMAIFLGMMAYISQMRVPGSDRDVSYEVTA